MTPHWKFAEWDGRRARRDGRLRTANPYAPATDDYSHWHQGWDFEDAVQTETPRPDHNHVL